VVTVIRGFPTRSTVVGVSIATALLVTNVALLWLPISTETFKGLVLMTKGLRVVVRQGASLDAEAEWVTHLAITEESKRWEVQRARSEFITPIEGLKRLPMGSNCRLVTTPQASLG
jgi:hypothetical protein